MKHAQKNKKGIISEFLVRILSILMLITMFMVFSLIVQLNDCSCSNKEVDETLSFDSNKALFSDTAVDNLLNNNITITFKGDISSDKEYSSNPILLRVIPEYKGYDNRQSSITLPLWKAISIYADYDKSVFKEYNEFKDELKKIIQTHISETLSKTNSSLNWKEFIIVDGKKIIIQESNNNVKKYLQADGNTFPSDYNTFHKTRTIPRLSFSSKESLIEFIIQYQK
ncbi:MAG TPA: hypothetical protein PLX15_02100 [Candidatus Woesearchaeota archaeon]|nr:hypothetical protein [Candidatus Woesearchaeota archaeon]